MMSPRTIARLGALVCLFVTASLWARTAQQSSAQPLLDSPGAIAANADGDVYVSFVTDYGAAVVRRFSADGVVLARWEVTRQDFAQHAIAEAGDGGLFVVLADADVVRRYSRDGQQTAEWPVAGLENAIATTSGGGTANTDVYVVTSLLGGGRAVLQYDPAGSLRASFPVDRSSYDLAVWPPGGADEASIAVAEAARNHKILGFVSRYFQAGTWLDGWGEDGTIAGMDVDSADNALWYGVFGTTRDIKAVHRDRTRGPQCRLRSAPIDLTVGQGGDLYVLADPDPDHSVARQVLRYRQNCTLVDTWDLQHLLDPDEPTPTVTTAAPSDTSTATAVAGTATETPTPDLLPGTLTPTATYTPCDGFRGLSLPVAIRGGA